MEKKSSWEKVKDWYDSLVGEEGHFYHQTVILPRIADKILASGARSVIDLACGQGVLSRHLDPGLSYTGVDLSPSLIEAAKRRSKNPNHRFFVGDVSKTLVLRRRQLYDSAALILAIQDIDDLEGVFSSAKALLQPEGALYLVMNHPCFRIPRQSRWGYDAEKKIQYRILESYMSLRDIPIQTQPGRKRDVTTHHHHRPLEEYFSALKRSGFLVEELEEWTSPKKSEGARRKSEDRARKEFPLFLFLKAVKSSKGTEGSPLQRLA